MKLGPRKYGTFYLIMKKATSPVVFIHDARPHEMYYSLGEARKREKELNSMATNNEYWVDKVRLCSLPDKDGFYK